MTAYSRRPKAALRCARPALLWGLALFLAGQFALGVSVEKWLPQLRDPEFGCRRSRLRKALSANPGRPLLVCLGSSRTAVGVKPSVVAARLPGQQPLVFNFGLTSTGPVREYMTLCRLWADGIRPQAVVVELMPAFLAYPAHRGEADRLDGSRLAWADLRFLRRFGSPDAGWVGQWAEARAVPVYAHRFVLMSRFEPEWLPKQCQLDYYWRGMDRLGWYPNPESNEDPVQYQWALQRARAQYTLTLRNFRISAAADRALRELLEECRQHDTAVVLVLMPEGGTFRQMYPKAARRQLQAYLEKLRRDCSTICIDARDWMAESDFSDGHHLLRTGAEAFSDRLGRELAPLLAARLGPRNQ